MDLLDRFCCHKPDHDLIEDRPVGPICGQPATHVIYWLDGTKRYSPCCAEHATDVGPEAPAHRVERLPS